MKKLSFLILALAALTNCTKQPETTDSANKPPTNLVGVSGTYSFSSQQTKQYGSTYLMSSQDYPCLANHIFTLNSDGTAIRNYIGTDTCYLTKGTTSSSYWGIPNGGTTKFNWRRSADTIYMSFENSAKEFVVMHSVVNQKSQLVFRDTVASMDWTSAKTYIK